MNAVLYARVSTEKQAEKDLSIPAQLRLMRDHAKQQGWTVVEEFVEPGSTATHANRPVFQRMLGRIADGSLQVEVVLTHKLNRLARNLDDYIPIRAALRKQGVRLTYVVERVDDSPSGRLLENVMASIAQFESANLSEETKKGMRERVLRGGWPHRPPRGYVMVRRNDAEQKGSHVEVHPREGPLITEAFALFATGQFSVDTVARKLVAKGLFGSTGKSLSHSHLHRILTNPFYTGRIHWQDLRVKGQHLPIIDTATFDRVQEVLRERFVKPLRFRTTTGFPLKGLATCARCRGNLTAERHGRLRYYRCCRQANRPELCDARYCPADLAHEGVLKVLKSLQLTRNNADLIAREAARIIERRMKSIAQKRRELEVKQADLVATETKLTEVFLAGHLSSDVHERKAAELRAERGQCDHQLQGLAVTPDALRAEVTKTLELSTTLLDVYEVFTDPRRSELLHKVFTNVVLGKNGLVGFTLSQSFASLQKARTPSAQAKALLSVA